MKVGLASLVAEGNKLVSLIQLILIDQIVLKTIQVFFETYHVSGFFQSRFRVFFRVFSRRG